MKFSHQDVITILGRRGCGKSFLGKQIQKVFPRKFIFDLIELNEYKSDIEIYNFNQFSEFIQKVENEELKTFTAVIKFSIHDNKRYDVFDQMIKTLYHLGACTIVVEEVQNFIDPHNIGDNFSHSFTTGRHRDLSIIMTTQRPSKMHKDALSQSTHIFCGNLTAKSDISHVADALNMKGDEIAQLDDCEFFHFCPFNKPKVKKINTRELFKENKKLTKSK